MSFCLYRSNLRAFHCAPTADCGIIRAVLAKVKFTIMLAENYELIETIMLYCGLAVLFALMCFAVHDVLKRNNVPAMGKIVTYGVLGLGAMGFVAKGIIELIWLSTRV